MKELRPYNYMAGLLCLSFAVSCVNDSYVECGPVVQPTHVVSVADKNYSNGAEFGNPIVVIDEALPFSSYVSSLTLWRHNAAISDYQIYNAELSPTDGVYNLSVESYPAGINRVTAIGNETVFSQNFSQSSTTITLHPEGREYEDIYIGAADVTIPPTADVDIEMRRAKGALVLFLENIPESAESLHVTVDNLYAAVDGSMNYSGSTSVSKEVEVTGTDMTLTLKLAPTVVAGRSTVALTLMDANGGRDSRNMAAITINRNEVSGIRAQLDNADEIYVYTNGDWNRVTPLDIIPQ